MANCYSIDCVGTVDNHGLNKRMDKMQAKLFSSALPTALFDPLLWICLTYSIIISVDVVVVIVVVVIIAVLWCWE